MAPGMLKLWGLGLLMASAVTAEPAEEATQGQEKPAEAEVKWSAYEHSSAAELKKVLAERPFNLVACEYSSETCNESR
jgi:hypothetical protein